MSFKTKQTNLLSNATPLFHFRACTPDFSCDQYAWLFVTVMSSLWFAGCSPIRQKTPLIVTPAPTKASSKPYVIEKRRYTPQRHYELVQTGMASFYGGRDGCHGSLTASGERFNMFTLTAAHKTLPLPCMILVENLENGKKIVLRVNDRGPYRCNRILDVSGEAARRLGFYHKGVARIRLKTLVKESLLLPENQPGFRRRRIKSTRQSQPRKKASLHYYVYITPCARQKLEGLKKRLKDWGQIGIRHCQPSRSHIVIGPYTSPEGAQQIMHALKHHHTCFVVPEKIRPIQCSRVLRCQRPSCTPQHPAIWREMRSGPKPRKRTLRQLTHKSPLPKKRSIKKKS